MSIYYGNFISTLLLTVNWNFELLGTYYELYKFVFQLHNYSEVIDEPIQTIGGWVGWAVVSWTAVDGSTVVVVARPEVDRCVSLVLATVVTPTYNANSAKRTRSASPQHKQRIGDDLVPETNSHLLVSNYYELKRSVLHIELNHWPSLSYANIDRERVPDAWCGTAEEQERDRDVGLLRTIHGRTLWVSVFKRRRTSRISAVLPYVGK